MSGHEAWLALTPAMRGCLEDARRAALTTARGLISPWDYGSSTIGALKRCGYLKTEREVIGGKASTRYALTEAGRKALEGT